MRKMKELGDSDSASRKEDILGRSRRRIQHKNRTALYLRVSTPDQKRVTAGMKAAAARGKHLGRPPLAPRLIDEIEALAASSDLSIRKIYEKIGQKVSRGRVGEITKRIRLGRKKTL